MVNIEDRIITDETGYNYVKVSPREIFNWGGMCICNSCNNQFLKEDMNLCFALTDTYCDKCFEDIKKRWRTYSKEDIEYDVHLQDECSLDWYKYHLDSDFRSDINKNNKLINDEILSLDDFDDIFGELSENN